MRVTILSFSLIALRRVRVLAPSLPTGLLLQLTPPGYRFGRLPPGVPILAPSIGLVRSRPGLVPAIRAAGAAAYVWTVNRHADLALVQRQPVTAVITDFPARALAEFGRPPPPPILE